MSALGTPVLINSRRAYWLSSIGSDVIHSTIQVDELDANVGRFSTLFGENITASTMNVSSLNFENSDVSGMYVSSIRGNSAFFSSLTIASDLSGGVGYVRFQVDASGVQVDGDPIRFDNLVYLTSSINIIQVSTVVDTDIFAQNGYFSTLSSGNISTGKIQFLDLSGTSGKISTLRVEDLSANYGAFNNLFVSSLEAVDISGVASGKNWSLYPTLNSSITFQPAYVLSNINNTLWFAGNELTDASGGGQDWSIFPAFSTVLMSNNSMTGISTLQFQDGGKLTSVTGNNLLYNGQNVPYGAAANVSLWANFPAVGNVNMNGNTLSNVSQINGNNLALSGSNITNGNTFTNSLGVGGTSLTSLTTITSGGDITCRNLQVGDPVTSLADVEIYGATAAPGDNALYVEGGVTCDGGTIHGFSAGVLPVGGINTGRIDMLQAGFNLLHPLVGAITTGAALGITAGGAISIAAGGYVEMNTSTLQMINTTSGNKNTTIQAGYLTVDPDIASSNSIKLFNTSGGGVEIDGGGQGSLIGFSTIQAVNLSSIALATQSISSVQGFISSVSSDSASFQRFSSVIGSVSTFTFADESGNISPPQSSFLNIVMGYDLSGAPNFAGLSIENYINQVDNVDFFLLGNGDGATITSWQNNRSNAAPLLARGQYINFEVDPGNSVQIKDASNNITTYLRNNSVSTQSLYVDDINGYSAFPAFANILTLSTMNLYAASTTLLAWSTATVSTNIDIGSYDLTALVGGVYKIGVALQMNNTSGSDQVEVFFQKNNTTISNSALIHTIANNEQTLMYLEIIEPLAVNDTIEIGMYTASSDLVCSTVQGAITTAPGAIVTMNRVDTV